MRNGKSMEIIVSPPGAVADNLQTDEEMLRSAAAEDRSVLRLWWGGPPAVVMGRSEVLDRVVDGEECRRRGVEILRRITGGGSVLLTRDVLSYSLTCPAPGLPDIRAIFQVGARLLVETLGELGLQAVARGTSDVAVGHRKVSGNAMARRWGGLLLHGTLVWDLDLDLVEACLRHPPREPDYRQGRSHRDFITTLRGLGVEGRPQLEEAVIAAARRLGLEGALDLSPYVRG